MLDMLKNAKPFQQSLFIMLVGLLMVFVVLVLFFVSIKFLSWLLPHKDEKADMSDE